MTQIAIVSAGAFGTAIAALLARIGHGVRLHVREKDVYHTIKNTSVNWSYLPGVHLDLGRISLFENIAEAVHGADMVIFAVPTQYAVETLQLLAFSIDSNVTVVMTTKGRASAELSLAETAEQLLPQARHCSLYGITFAPYIATGSNLASICIASRDRSLAGTVADLFRHSAQPLFRIYVSDDVDGIQYCAAMKNVYAITMGLIDGWLQLRSGESSNEATMALLQSRQTLQNECLVEFIKLGLSQGAELHTLIGPAGIGDIVASSTSASLSRNYRWGLWYASTQLGTPTTRPPDIHEGYETCSAMFEIAKTLQIEAPVLEATNAILFEGAQIKNTMDILVDKLKGIALCGGLDVLLRRAAKVNKRTSAYKPRRTRPSMFIAYHFNPRGEMFVSTVKTIAALHDVEIVTGVSEGAKPHDDTVSRVIDGKIGQCDLFMALTTNDSKEAGWVGEERLLAGSMGKPILLFLEQGSPREHLGRFNPDHPIHEFTSKTFATIFETQIEATLEGFRGSTGDRAIG